MAHQSTGYSTSARTSYPTGVCIQEFNAMIQKADRVVPRATAAVEMVCTRGGTRCMPNNMMPRNVASMKNAVSTSYPRSGPAMLPARSMKPGQLVPN